MKAKATIHLKFTSEKQIDTILKSLEPETKNPTITRASTSLEKQGNLLTLKVQAKDTVALRATLNAYLRWINSLLNVFELLEVQ